MGFIFQTKAIDAVSSPSSVHLLWKCAFREYFTKQGALCSRKQGMSSLSSFPWFKAQTGVWIVSLFRLSPFSSFPRYERFLHSLQMIMRIHCAVISIAWNCMREDQSNTSPLHLQVLLAMIVSVDTIVYTHLREGIFSTNWEMDAHLLKWGFWIVECVN